MTGLSRRTKLAATAIIGAAALSIHSTAVAGISCAGPVNVVLFQPDGDLMIDWGHGYNILCSFDGDVTYGGVTYTTADCQRIHATAMTAMGIGADISFYFPGSYTSCSQVLNPYQLPFADWNSMYLIAQ